MMKNNDKFSFDLNLNHSINFSYSKKNLLNHNFKNKFANFLIHSFFSKVLISNPIFKQKENYMNICIYLCKGQIMKIFQSELKNFNLYLKILGYKDLKFQIKKLRYVKLYLSRKLSYSKLKSNLFYLNNLELKINNKLKKKFDISDEKWRFFDLYMYNLKFVNYKQNISNILSLYLIFKNKNFHLKNLESYLENYVYNNKVSIRLIFLKNPYLDGEVFSNFIGRKNRNIVYIYHKIMKKYNYQRFLKNHEIIAQNYPNFSELSSKLNYMNSNKDSFFMKLLPFKFLTGMKMIFKGRKPKSNSLRAVAVKRDIGITKNCLKNIKRITSKENLVSTKYINSSKSGSYCFNIKIANN